MGGRIGRPNWEAVRGRVRLWEALIGSDRSHKKMWEAVRGRSGRPNWEAKVGGSARLKWEAVRG